MQIFEEEFEQKNLQANLTFNLFQITQRKKTKIERTGKKT